MFRDRAKILKQYLSVVLEPLDGVLCWCHRAFTRPDLRFYDRFWGPSNMQRDSTCYTEVIGGDYVFVASVEHCLITCCHMT